MIRWEQKWVPVSFRGAVASARCPFCGELNRHQVRLDIISACPHLQSQTMHKRLVRFAQELEQAELLPEEKNPCLN